MKVDNLYKGYDDLEVIKSFSIEIDRGDKIGVIGNNGRGKTTLLKMLAKVMAPEKGKSNLATRFSSTIFLKIILKLLKKREIKPLLIG